MRRRSVPSRAFSLRTIEYASSSVRSLHSRVVLWGGNDTPHGGGGGRRRRRRDDDDVGGPASHPPRASRLVSFAPLTHHPAADDAGPIRAVSVCDDTPSARAMRHLGRGVALVYTGGDYRNALQLHRALGNRVGGRRAPTAGRTRTARGGGGGGGVVDRDGEGGGGVAETRSRWTRLAGERRERSEVVRGLLIRLSVGGGGGGDDDGESERERAPVGILGLKRTPPNAGEILSYAFRNEVGEEGWAKSDDECSVADDASFAEILLPLSEFLGMVGGYEWHRKGVHIDALGGGCIHPHFGVFPPTRQDYIGLLDNVRAADGGGGSGRRQRATALLEVGIGTGVLSAVLLRRDVVHHAVGTDVDHRAVACARDNARRLGLGDRLDVVRADLFPPDDGSHPLTTRIMEEGGGFDVVLFNPPWLPGDAPTSLDGAVYDPGRGLLRRFVSRVHRYVNRSGHVYILLSNLGALLGLYEERDLHDMFEEGNLDLVEVYEVKSKGSSRRTEDDESRNTADYIANARAREIISLYKLSVKIR